MTTSLSHHCTAFRGSRILASGELIDVALAVKTASPAEDGDAILTFDDRTGRVMDLDLRGTTAEVVARLAALPEFSVDEVPGGGSTAEARSGQEASPRRGRPKLGVVAREVTLLPRHWDWLAKQRGGASQALRRLVDEARKADAGHTESRLAQEAAYRFLSAMAGDLPGFEEATRALFADDPTRFAEHAADWPEDVSRYAHRLAWGTTTNAEPDEGPCPLADSGT